MEMRKAKMKKTKVIINLIVIILIWLGIFASGLWYGTVVYGDYVEELQQEQELLKREVQAFTKVSDPKTIRLYVKEFNKILDDITFLGKIVESGQISAELLDLYFKEYGDKLESVNGRIKRLDTELGKFGVGLKWSSLSQADEIIVISQDKNAVNLALRRISYPHIKRTDTLKLLTKTGRDILHYNDAMESLGHSSITTTQNYLKSLENKEAISNTMMDF